MQIIKKEMLEFSEKEANALQLVATICLAIDKEASAPELKKMASELYDKIYELWGWEK